MWKRTPTHRPWECNPPRGALGPWPCSPAPASPGPRCVNTGWGKRARGEPEALRQVALPLLNNLPQSHRKQVDVLWPSGTVPDPEEASPHAWRLPWPPLCKDRRSSCALKVTSPSSACCVTQRALVPPPGPS